MMNKVMGVVAGAASLIQQAQVTIEGQRQRIHELESLLREVQVHRYHEPDSDAYEHCAGCGNLSDRWGHKENCLVVKIARALKK